MNPITQGRGRSLEWTVLRRVTRKVATVVRELNYAQRRSTELFLARDGYLAGPVIPVTSYREFLDRTSGPLVHEPSALARLTGEPVR